MQQVTGISGTIFYENWPTDSLRDLRLVVFKYYPPDSIKNEILGGRAFVYPGLTKKGLPFNVDSTNYIHELDPGEYGYVVVAQRYGSDVLADWRAVGQYDTVPADVEPSAVTVIADSLLYDIDIYVDFDNLPPQPF
jgi:hypothetical protein